MKQYYLLIILMAMLTLPIAAENVKVEQFYYNLDADSQTATLTQFGNKYNAWRQIYEGHLVIPESIEYNGIRYAITAIGDSAFINQMAVTSVDLPIGIKHIGHRAFRKTGITSVTIPRNVRSLGLNVFEDCQSLDTVIWNAVECTIPKDLNGRFCLFSKDNSISSFLFGPEVETIPAGVCQGLKNLARIRIPSSVSRIEAKAFKDCSRLDSVTIPGTVKSIDFGAFQSCTGLTSVTLEEGIVVIDTAVFNNDPALTSIAIPKTLRRLGRAAFLGCYGLRTVYWDAEICDVEEAKLSWFDRGSDTYVSTLTFGPNVRVIPANLSENSEWIIRDAIVPATITRVEEKAFRKTRNLLYQGALEGAPWGARYVFVCRDGDLLYGDSMKTHVVHYEKDTLCFSLPSSVQTIDPNAFSGVLELLYDGSAVGAPWGARVVNGYHEGSLIYADASKQRLVRFLDTLATEVTLPESLTTIDDSAFVNCRAIANLTIPSSVTSVGPFSVDEIQNVTYHGSAKVQARALNGYVEGALVFKDATKKEIISCSLIPQDSVCVPFETEKIGAFAFSGCYIGILDIPGTLKEVSDYTFSYLECNVLFMAPCTPPKVVHYTFENEDDYDEPLLDGIEVVVLPKSSKVYQKYKKSKFWRRFQLLTYDSYLAEYTDYYDDY